MTQLVLIPILALLSSMLAAVIIFALPEQRHRLRTGINLLAALIKVVLVGVMTWGLFISWIMASATRSCPVSALSCRPMRWQ